MGSKVDVVFWGGRSDEYPHLINMADYVGLSV